MDFKRNNAVKLGRETCDIPQHLEKLKSLLARLNTPMCIVHL